MVISSNSIDAPFPLSKTNTIDAASIQDAKTGKNYLTYGSWWANIWQFELTKDLRSVKMPTARQLSYTYDPVLPGAEYTIFVGRSKSPRGPFVDRNGKDLVEGGGSMVYGSHGNTYGPGGQAVISNYSGRDVLYYHYVNTTFDPLYRDNMKFLGWNPIEYIKGWPVLVK
jgi:arabinan endo-1,5-alpha-L-arabinosidase